jgi:PKD repeat protein
MSPRPHASGLRFPAGILFSFWSLFSPPSAQLGHVVKAQKISASSGGFTAQLDEMDQFGRSIVNLGDLDGDGVSDLLVGSHTDDDGGLDKGSVYILFLQANGFVKSWQKISDLEGNFAGRLDRGDQFGRAAVNLGDLDGDGVVDVAVSANYDDDGGTNKGAVYVLFLNTDGTVKASQKISSTQGGFPAALDLHDEFGRSITSLGDLDGDGVTDLLVGTPEDDEGGTNTGALHVLFLHTDGTVKAYRRISRSTDGLHLKPGDWFGFSSTNLGDIDGDGVTDVAVGAVLDDDGGVNQGSVWILCLNPDGSVKRASEIDELEGGFGAQLDDIDQFGTSVTNLGDLDGDGMVDIAVGAVKDDDGGPPGDPDADVGAVYVLFLKADGTVKSWTKISDLVGDFPYSLDQYDWFGSALAGLGGASLDGLINLAIGCRNDDGPSGSNQGAIYLVQLNDGTVPVAAFHPSRTLGVAPLTVEFEDQSQGEVTAWLWNLGNGPQTNVPSPTRTYELPGIYDVQLTVRGPKGLDVTAVPGLITVVTGPLADFDATPRRGPCPLAVSFADLSEGEVTSWSWDFGDGTSSSERAPQHTYADCGGYTVQLTVQGPTGTHTHSVTDFVVAALEAPQAAFTRTPSFGPAPLDVQFQDTSLGLVSSWNWDFGDGGVASGPAPTHTYSTPGSYTVSLTVGGPGGSASETLVGAVQVDLAPPDADFDATPTLGPEPLTVLFSDLSRGEVTSWNWDFGDGANSSERSPLHVYTTPGRYTASLTVTGSTGSDSLTRFELITVEAAPPGAAFSATPTAGDVPLNVQFTDLSTLDVTSVSWDFGDGTTSTARRPLHVYDRAGLFTVSLTARGPGGSDTLALADLIQVTEPPLEAGFSADPRSGTAPLTVAFEDRSSSGVTGYLWDFGDGSSATLVTPVHTYSVAGTYDVRLTVRAPRGTAEHLELAYVQVSEPAPAAAFEATPTSGIAPLVVLFQDRSLGNVTTWAWDFGDGTSSRERSPQHLYASPGIYSVSLTVVGPGGESTHTGESLLQVNAPPPSANFTLAPANGPAPLSVAFTDLSSGAITSRSWDFGDGAMVSAANPTHVYTTPGSYSVTLKVQGPGGSAERLLANAISVAPPPPSADFGAAPTSGAAPLGVQFADLTAGVVGAWAWDFGDGSTSAERNPLHVYATPGTYSVTLTASGPGGESQHAQQGLVSVRPPLAADFQVSAREGPAPLAVSFTDTSTGLVTAWDWDFADGARSSLRDPQHVFQNPMSYPVTLVVRGPDGTSERRRTLVAHDVATFADGSFELDLAGAAPAGAWAVYSGRGTRVRAGAPLEEAGFASHGSQWCDLGAEGSSSARPPSNPRGLGNPAFGAAGIQQDFAFPRWPHLFFDAAFLLDGDPRSSTRNDFMSVDLTDGLSTWNLYYADSFSALPQTSPLHGLAMTKLETVHVDLAELFPNAGSQTRLSLRASVGNVGGATRPSRGYVDGFRFAPTAKASYRNGAERNPAFYAADPARLGATWTFEVDPAVMPDARSLVIVARASAANLAQPGGELLVGGPALFRLAFPLHGGRERIAVPIPDLPELAGRTVATQAVLVGKGFRLGNAFDLLLGY